MAGKNSIPKMQVYNNAFLSSKLSIPVEYSCKDSGAWGRLIESAVGASLINWAHAHGATLRYWKDGNLEVDFVLQNGGKITAIEVKSGNQGINKGLVEFHKRYPDARCLLVSERGDGIKVQAESFLGNLDSYFDNV